LNLSITTFQGFLTTAGLHHGLLVDLCAGAWVDHAIRSAPQAFWPAHPDSTDKAAGGLRYGPSRLPACDQMDRAVLCRAGAGNHLSAGPDLIVSESASRKFKAVAVRSKMDGSMYILLEPSNQILDGQAGEG
jgi:hypothetical protein